MKPSGYPHGRRGYVVDHIVPLKCGGADSPSDMQRQAKVTAKAKAKVESPHPRRMNNHLPAKPAAESANLLPARLDGRSKGKV